MRTPWSPAAVVPPSPVVRLPKSFREAAMATSFFARQLAMYASYHRDARNRATHFVGIPAIVFALLAALALWRFPLFGLDVSAAWVLAALAVAGWIALDAIIGLAMLVVMLPLLVAA